MRCVTVCDDCYCNVDIRKNEKEEETHSQIKWLTAIKTWMRTI